MRIIGGIKCVLFTFSIISPLNKEQRSIAYASVLYLFYFHAVNNLERERERKRDNTNISISLMFFECFYAVYDLTKKVQDLFCQLLYLLVNYTCTQFLHNLTILDKNGNNGNMFSRSGSGRISHVLPVKYAALPVVISSLAT